MGTFIRRCTLALIMCGFALKAMAQTTVVATPTASVLEGYYKTAQSVELNCETDGATIHYTTDGTEPTSSSTEYTGAIAVSATTTIKAVAIKDAVASGVMTEQYNIGDYLFAQAFTEETNRYKVVGLNDVYSGISVGRSAILTFRMYGRTNSSTLTLGVTENYTGGSTHTINGEVLSPSLNVWTTQTFAIPILHDNATLTLSFSGSNTYIDDVVLVAPPTITLDENANNAQTLSDHSGQIVDVATKRTLRAGIWNTLCLPFEVTIQVLNTAFGEGYSPAIRKYNAYSNNVMSFATVSGTNGKIPAGEPFLLKISSEVVNPTFRVVTISATEPAAVTKGDVKLQGIFSQENLATDGSDLFIGTDNFLYQPALGSNTMGGLRAYIHRTNTNARISLNMDGDEAVTVNTLRDTTEPPRVAYTLQGQRTASPRRDLYIVDGKKVVVKQ